MVEHSSPKRGVIGSSPIIPAMKEQKEKVRILCTDFFDLVGDFSEISANICVRRNVRSSFPDALAF